MLNLISSYVEVKEMDSWMKFVNFIQTNHVAI